MRAFRFFRAAVSVVAALATVPVQAEPPKLGSLSSDYVQRGTSSTVTLHGEHLGGVSRIVIDGAPGLSASIVPAATQAVGVESSLGGISTVTPPDEKTLRVVLEVAADAALTDRELRAISAEGVSNPLPVRLSTLREMAAAGDHHSTEKAQRIEFPAAVSGVISAGTQSHFYKFSAKAGEPVILDVYAARIGSPLDSSLAILDKDGKELARNEDAAGLDSTLYFTPPESGEYVVQLRDFRYQGAGNYRYRLIAGALPHVKSAFPFGGQRGTAVEVQLRGINLEGAEKMPLRLEANSPAGRQELRASNGRGFSNPFLFEVSDLPQVMEQEPNSALDQADAVSLPAALNGRMDQDGDYDAFRFTAEKGQRFVFDVNAWVHGSAVDGLLTIADSRGNVLQRSDDAGEPDPRIDYTFPETGEYYLLLEDLLGRGGEEFGYRIAVSQPQPDFSVTFLPDAPRVRRGDRVPVRCELNRVNGFNEAVTVTVEGLPAGMYAEPLLLPANAPASGWMFIHASADAPIGTHALKIAARGVSSGSLVRGGTPLAGDKPARAGYITVLEAAPFSVEAATLMASVEQNQSSAVEVVVDRKNGFAGEVKITAEGFSTGREPITRSFEFAPLTIPGGETRGTLTMKARLDSEVATRPVYLRAEGTANGRAFLSYSSPIPISTSPIPFVLSTTLKRVGVTVLPEGSESAAGEAVFVVRAERRAGFNGEIELKVEGVPEGVRAEVPKVPAGAGEITVKLVSTPTAAPGKEHALTVTGTGLHNDRIYRFQPATVMLTVSAPEMNGNAEAKLAAAANETK